MASYLQRSLSAQGNGGSRSHPWPLKTAIFCGQGLRRLPWWWYCSWSAFLLLSAEWRSDSPALQWVPEWVGWPGSLSLLSMSCMAHPAGSMPTTTGEIASWGMYRQFSNISGTESPNINISLLILQSSKPNPLKPGVKGTAHLKQHSY